MRAVLRGYPNRTEDQIDHASALASHFRLQALQRFQAHSPSGLRPEPPCSKNEIGLAYFRQPAQYNHQRPPIHHPRNHQKEDEGELEQGQPPQEEEGRHVAPDEVGRAHDDEIRHLDFLIGNRTGQSSDFWFTGRTGSSVRFDCRAVRWFDPDRTNHRFPVRSVEPAGRFVQLFPVLHATRYEYVNRTGAWSDSLSNRPISVLAEVSSATLQRSACEYFVNKVLSSHSAALVPKRIRIFSQCLITILGSFYKLIPKHSLDFMGYLSNPGITLSVVRSQLLDNCFIINNGIKQLSSIVPIFSLIASLAKAKFCNVFGHPISKPAWTDSADSDIIEPICVAMPKFFSLLQWIFKKKTFYRIKYILRLSCARTLAPYCSSYRLSFWLLDKEPYSPEDEDTAVFCLGLLIEITVKNRDRIMLLWQSVYEHIANVVQSTVMPCTLVEKAVFGLLQICQRLLPYKENLTDELLRSLRLVLKLDARVADAYCEHITQEVMHLLQGNALQIRSRVGWRTIISLLSITAQHPEASEVGFETLVYIMSDAAHLSPANYVLCVDAAVCKAAAKVYQDIGEMWMRLVQGLKRLGLDRREQVRNHAILVLQRCLIGAEGIYLPQELWLQCFDTVIFALLDDLLNVGQGSSVKDYRSMEGTFVLAVKLLSKVFLQLLQDDSAQKYLTSLWEGYLNRMESFMKAKFRGKWSENVHEVVPELLKNTLLIMKAKGILVASDAAAAGKDNSLWQLTWLHVKQIAPSLQTEIFSSHESEQMQRGNEVKTGSMTPSDGAVLVPTTNEIKA
uniref:Uncharacterized protein n=1 Tax=Kalanchoe fedtschenkoi TaxID=63787 RepID=A0A7N0VLG9_KALFE